MWVPVVASAVALAPRDGQHLACDRADAAWNSVIQGPFDEATTGSGTTLWVGEPGILTRALD